MLNLPIFQGCQQYDYPTFGWIRLPDVEIPKEEKENVGLTKESKNVDFLKALARKGFTEKVTRGQQEEYGERAKKELEIIEKLGFVDYFLLIWKLTSWADQQKIAR